MSQDRRHLEQLGDDEEGGDRELVEATIAQLRRVFDVQGDDDGATGVREPRRRPPNSGAGAVSRAA